MADDTTSATDLPAPAAESDRFALLDLDLPDAPAPLPAWAERVLTVIRAIVVGLTLESADLAFAALSRAVEPARAYPEGPGRAAVRDAMQAKLAEINALRARLRPAQPAATPAPVAAPVAVAPPVTQAAAPRPVHHALWARVTPTEWGARITTNLGVPLVGDEVIVHRARGAGVSTRWISGPATSSGVYPVAATRITMPAPVAPVAAQGSAPVVASVPVASVATPALAPQAEQTYTRRAGVEADLADTLDAASAEGMRNSAAVAAQGSARGVLLTRSSAETRALRATQTETRAQVQALLNEKTLIAGAVAAGSMLQVSWAGGGQTTLGKVREALAAIGREHDAPEAPSVVRHAGRAVESLKSREWDTARLPSNGLPNGIKARWLVGRKLTGANVRAGESYGHAELIVSLTEGGALTFDGDAVLAGSVRSHFAAATARETLKSEDLTAWLGKKLRDRHYAVKRGVHFYVPGGQAEAARALCEAIAKLWGDHDQIPVTTGPDLLRALTRGLADEVAAIEEGLTKDTALAAERAATKAREEATKRGASPEAIEADAQFAARRATVSPVVAARIMRELATVAARVDGYAVVLGEASTVAVKALIRTLRDRVEPLCTDGDIRASMLELA